MKLYSSSLELSTLQIHIIVYKLGCRSKISITIFFQIWISSIQIDFIAIFRFEPFYTMYGAFCNHLVTVKKANTQNTMVNLFIHPYDYEEALTLIEELFRSNMNPSPKWRKQWDEYLSNIPNYYIPHLRFVLT